MGLIQKLLREIKAIRLEPWSNANAFISLRTLLPHTAQLKIPYPMIRVYPDGHIPSLLCLNSLRCNYFHLLISALRGAHVSTVRSCRANQTTCKHRRCRRSGPKRALLNTALWLEQATSTPNLDLSSQGFAFGL